MVSVRAHRRRGTRGVRTYRRRKPKSKYRKRYYHGMKVIESDWSGKRIPFHTWDVFKNDEMIGTFRSKKRAQALKKRAKGSTLVDSYN